jgi:CDP-glucose 4,6-dehydratase
MRSAFVTGGYGLLGSALVRALLDRGVEVTVLRRDATPRSALVLEGLESRVNVVTGDVTNGALIERALGEYEADSVFHLAAQTIVGTSERSPLGTWETNVRGTWTVLEACRRLQVSRTLVAASDKAYGAHDELPYREDFALQPRFPYEVSKASADLIARSYWHTYGLPVATTRLANLYGGGDANRSRLVPEAIAAALAGRRPVIRSDGTPERDFLYVDDAVEAYLAVAAALDGGGACGQAFNAGSGQPHPVREIVEVVCRVAGSDVEPDIRGQGTPHGEIDRQYVDATKLRELTGWRPEVSLEEGLQRTVEWYRAYPAVLENRAAR